MRSPGGSLQDNSNAHQLNNVIANFHTGFYSQFKGKDTLFRASLSCNNAPFAYDSPTAV